MIEIKVLGTHYKGAWRVMVYDNGVIWAESNYKVQVNTGHRLMPGAAIAHWMPQYVKDMVEDARELYNV